MPKNQVYPRQIHLLGKDGNYYNVMVKPNRKYGTFWGRELIALYSKRRRRHNPEIKDPSQMLLV